MRTLLELKQYVVKLKQYVVKKRINNQKLEKNLKKKLKT